MITFYPGPSRIYSNVTLYIQEAYMEGILSANHRSAAFMDLYIEVRKLFHEKLNLPEGYEVFFVSSATECWEIIQQSVVRQQSQHFFNGSFGEKWYQTASKFKKKTISQPFEINEPLPYLKVDHDSDVWCITQNETSNGTQVTEDMLRLLNNVRTKNQLLAIDVTSSLGGIQLDMNLGDIWFSSVQKCLGLPAGLGVLILSPQAINRVFEINDQSYYNSLTTIIQNGRLNQTHFTPNVLLIYLLKRTLNVSKGIAHQHEKIRQRFEEYSIWIEESSRFSWLVENPACRSATVLALRHDDIKGIKEKASNAGIIIGNGYGRWKDTTIRIANFPAIKSVEIEKLNLFMDRYSLK